VIRYLHERLEQLQYAAFQAHGYPSAAGWWRVATSWWWKRG
jgi:hypothetical protein